VALPVLITPPQAAESHGPIQLLCRPVAGSSGEHVGLPHVLLILDQFPRTLGGGERVILRLASLLPKYGYQVSILTFFVDPESSVLSAPAPCPIYLLPLRRTYDLEALQGALALRRFLREQKIQLVQTFFESSDLWAGLVVKTLSRAKLIWSRRDMGILRGRKHKVAYRLMASAPDKVFAVSEQVRKHCMEVDRIECDRVLTIYNGLDLPEEPPLPQPAKSAGHCMITTVGNIRRVKGHDLFIRAAAVVLQQFPQASFSIAGEVLEPDYFNELQKLVEELNLSDRFHFVGGVANPREHLRSADLFVLPSRSEGFSNAIIEAMAASLPVVATHVGGNAEAVQDGLTGFVIPPEDVGALADAMIRLLANPAAAQRMGAAGRRVTAERFTTGAMMRRITAIYEDLLLKG
jgi:glycosyltransferase involved in cell wall biosynthesis